MQRLLTMLFLLCAAITAMPAAAQKFGHRKFKYEWDEALPVDIPVDSAYRNYDAVILNEECRISLINNTFRRYARFRFSTQAGIDKFNSFPLPQKVDPYFYRIIYPVEKQSSVYNPKVKDDGIIFIAARIIRDGQYVKAVIQETVEEEYKILNAQRLPFYSYQFYVRNLLPGDELEVAYAHDLPQCDRYFFNDPFPKQSSIVHVMVPDPFIHEVTMRNFPAERDSIYTSKADQRYITYTYSMENIAPVNPQWHNRAHEDLPFLEFYSTIIPAKAGLIDNKHNVARRITWRDFLYASANYRPELDYEYYMTKNDGVTTSLNALYERINKDCADSSIAYRLRHMQEILNDEFGYKNDYQYFSGRDNELENLDKYLGENIIRQRSILRIYVEMMYRFAEDYHFAIIPDKRLSTIDENNYRPQPKLHYAFAKYEDGKTLFLTPKDARRGLYANEFPFYLTDSKSFLIPQLENEKIYFNSPYKMLYPLVYTPAYNSWDNQRSATSKIYADLDSMKLHFNSRVKMSGQYSTMNRGAYLEGYCDSSVNVLYNKTIYGLLPGVTLHKQELIGQEKTYPYSTDIGMYYSSDKMVRNMGDSLALLDMKHCINPIFQEKFTVAEYAASYYPDFEGEDRFRYRLLFRDPVKLLNGEDYLFLINNHLGTLKSSLTQVSPVEIVFDLRIVIHASEVDRQFIKDVEDLFRVIEKISDLKVLVSKKT